MEGRNFRRGLTRDGTERMLISCGDAGRSLAARAQQQLESAGLACTLDHLLLTPAGVPPLTLERLGEVSMLVLAISRRCGIGEWRLELIRAAQSLAIPVLVLFEGREQEWQETLVPTLVTADIEELAGFAGRSRPDVASVWEFAQQFFVDRPTARQFTRDAPGRWRWQRRSTEGMDAVIGELSLCDEPLATSSKVDVTLVEAKSVNGMPVVFMGTSNWQRYRLAWSGELRAAVPAPVWPGSRPIGFMHCDFDTGREWPRAGSPPVEMQLMGREVYGWHMSEYFWRAFVGSLPQLLGVKPDS